MPTPRRSVICWPPASGRWRRSCCCRCTGGARGLDADFLDAVQPRVVALQSDRANVLGDPDPDVLRLLPDVPFFRTDLQGTLHFYTNGTDLYVETER